MSPLWPPCACFSLFTTPFNPKMFGAAPRAEGVGVESHRVAGWHRVAGSRTRGVAESQRIAQASRLAATCWRSLVFGSCLKSLLQNCYVCTKSAELLHQVQSCYSVLAGLLSPSLRLKIGPLHNFLLR